ncbi:MAG: ABC-F family ATP-binding cassette domain-containing protein [Myxococcales bacterium]|nr:ABC-F family ATP-binding cassette domain-containing protein [Myxococcales bacterium]
MPAITADHVTKTYGPATILGDVSLAIELGEKVGLVGNNGAGKSTLAKILAGVEEPDGGVIARNRSVRVMYLSQEPRIDPTRTVYQAVEDTLEAWREATLRYEAVSDAIAIGRAESDLEALAHEQTELAATIERLGGWDPRHKINAVLGHLGMTQPNQLVATLSGGEKRRVALAQVLVAAPELAILDEPTNHLDVETAEWLEQWLANDFTGAVLLVTHDRYFLDRVVTRTLELDRGVVYSYDGNYSDFLTAKAERLEIEARTEARRMNLLRKERDWLSRGPPARTTKQKARIDRAAELEETVVADRRYEPTTRLQAAAVRTGKRILELHGVSKRYGERVLIDGLELYLTPGERLGVIGRNGTGKTTLIKMVLGEEAPSAGEVVLGQNTKISYFDQGRADLDDQKSVYDNLFQGSDKVRVGDQWIDLRSYLEQFLFDGHKQRQKVGSLSGGERARVALAKMLRGDANLLILDEPTNDLDLATLGALEEMLTEWPGCAVVVTHDRWFLDRVATHILAFEGDGKVVHTAGDWSTWRAMKAETQRQALAGAVTRPMPSVAPPRKANEPDAKPKEKALTLPEVKELARLPDEIDTLERDIAAMEAQLADPMFYARLGAAVSQHMADLETRRGRLDALLQRWEELERRATKPR